jgi:hypothetical protein
MVCAGRCLLATTQPLTVWSSSINLTTCHMSDIGWWNPQSRYSLIKLIRSCKIMKIVKPCNSHHTCSSSQSPSFWDRLFKSASLLLLAQSRGCSILTFWEIFIRLMCSYHVEKSDWLSENYQLYCAISCFTGSYARLGRVVYITNLIMEFKHFTGSISQFLLWEQSKKSVKKYKLK